MLQAQEASSVRRGEGEALWWFGALAEIKATGADTAGQLTLVEITCAPGYEGVPHVHHREDEGFWILEGEVTLEVAGETIEMVTGDYAFGPRDIPHSFKVGDTGCRMLFIFTPAGIEDFIRKTSEPAQSRATPPPSQQAPDIEELKELAKEYGAEILL